MKKVITILILVLLLAAIPIIVVYNNQQKELRSHATPATTLSFNPGSPSKKANDTFSLDVIVNTGSNTISAAKLMIQADGDKVKITGISAGTFLANTLVDPSFTDTQASITLGSPPTSPKQGTGTLATVSFQVTGTSGVSRVTFTGSQIAGISEQSNVLSQTVPATISIVEPVATPTQTATATNTPQATPTPTPTQSAAANTPTPTPTQTQPSTTTNTGGGSTLPVTGIFEPKMLVPIFSALGAIVLGIML